MDSEEKINFDVLPVPIISGALRYNLPFVPAEHFMGRKKYVCFHVPEERIVPFLQILLLTTPHKKAQIVPPERKCKFHYLGYPQDVPLEQVKIFKTFCIKFTREHQQRQKQ